MILPANSAISINEMLENYVNYKYKNGNEY